MKASSAPHELKMEEYICYLYLAIADADMHIAATEVEAARVGLEKLRSRHYPQSSETVAPVLESVEKFIRTQSEYEKKQTISRLSKKFPLSVDLKIDIISDMHDLIHADEFVAMSEYNMLNYIRLWLVG
jgi:uncharacterized tellurite resistance protein B-like protein